MSEEKQQQDTAIAEPAAEAGDGDRAGQLQREADTLRDQLLRALADQENVRRRAAREREDAARFAAWGLGADLLPTLDSLRRAIDSVPGEQAAADDATRNLLAGVAMIERALLTALEKQGIRQLDVAPGDRFDPNRHHAMFEVDDSEHPAGTVAQIIQPGYVYHDRLLRPAMVGVARSPDDGNAAEGAASDAGVTL